MSPISPNIKTLYAPAYTVPLDVDRRMRIGMAVESMKRHMTDEGWQIFDGLEKAGYNLYGYALPNPETDVHKIIQCHPAVCVMQDKREWDVPLGNFREARARFLNITSLASRPDIFKVTILKDAQNNLSYHRQSADEIGCHAWIVYYNPDRVKVIAPYVRRKHLIRTYHTIDPSVVPAYKTRQLGCFLSGAVSSAYPLRERLFRNNHALPETFIHRHPGYHRNGSNTPGYIKLLSQYKVAICTASRYGYALRKIIEATAAGCVVLTDLPEDDCLPDIDGNLCRIPNSATIPFVADTIRRILSEYNPEKQAYFAESCKRYYDYREEGKRLARNIEEMRVSYGRSTDVAQ